MPKEDTESLPLVEQIVAQVFEGLAQNSAFNAETIGRLRELVKSGDLAKYEQIISALSVKGGK